MRAVDLPDACSSLRALQSRPRPVSSEKGSGGHAFTGDFDEIELRHVPTFALPGIADGKRSLDCGTASDFEVAVEKLGYLNPWPKRRAAFWALPKYLLSDFIFGGFLSIVRR